MRSNQEKLTAFEIENFCKNANQIKKWLFALLTVCQMKDVDVDVDVDADVDVDGKKFDRIEHRQIAKKFFKYRFRLLSVDTV